MKKILHVEDSSVMRMYVQRHINAIDPSYKVLPAVDGKDGVEKAISSFESGETIDLVLMDYQLPVMDGLEATRKIREYEAGINAQEIEGSRNVRTPIVMLTTEGEIDDDSTKAEFDYDDILLKPVKRENIQPILEKYIPKKG